MELMLVMLLAFACGDKSEDSALTEPSTEPAVEETGAEDTGVSEQETGSEETGTEEEQTEDTAE